MEYKMTATRIFVLLYFAHLFPIIEGVSNEYLLREGNIKNKPDRSHARILENDQSQTINVQRRVKHRDSRYRSSPKTTLRRLKSDKKSKKQSADRRDNIFNRNNGDESSSEERSDMPLATESSDMDRMTITGKFSKPTTPIERNVPTNNPVTIPTVSPIISYHSSSRHSYDSKTSNEVITQGTEESPDGPPTKAPVRMPTRQWNNLRPPTRGETNYEDNTRSSNSVGYEDPCDENDDRNSKNNPYLNVREHDVEVNWENEEIDDGDGVSVESDSTEMEVGIDQGIIENEEIIEDPTSKDEIEGNDISSLGSKEDNSSETWKYVLIGVGSSCLLFISVAIFLRNRPPDIKAYGFAGNKDGSIKLETIDNTIPLDQTGGYSGYSRMNSTKSFGDFEESKASLPGPSLDFRLQPHDPGRQSSHLQSRSPSSNPSYDPSYESRSMYESELEGQTGNIDNYTDDDYTNNDDHDDYEDIEDEDVYYDYEIEDPETEEIDDLDMEESTLSWEEEEYLSTIEEESNTASGW